MFSTRSMRWLRLSTACRSSRIVSYCGMLVSAASALLSASGGFFGPAPLAAFRCSGEGST